MNLALIVFPDGAGYVCPDGAAWHTTEFAFRVPSAAQAVPTARILLRNAGVGDAAWRNLALREIISP